MAYLDKKNKKFFFLSLICLLFLSLFLIIYIKLNPSRLKDYPELNSCFKTSVYSIYLCPSSNTYASLNEISKPLVYSILMSEDDKFFNHSGVDWDEFKKSLKKNLQAGKFARGGSTITQQLIKNIYLKKEKSISRKIQEFQLARQLESQFSKALILEKYLNIIELGDNIFGVKQAASKYFNKLPSEINYLEGLYLATLLPSPIKYSASFKKRKLSPWQKERMKTHLKRLLKRKLFTEEEYKNYLLDLDLFPWDISEKQMDREFLDDVLDDDNNQSLDNKSRSEVGSKEELLHNDSNDTSFDNKTESPKIEDPVKFRPQNQIDDDQENSEEPLEEDSSTQENEESVEEENSETLELETEEGF